MIHCEPSSSHNPHPRFNPLFISIQSSPVFRNRVCRVSNDPHLAPDSLPQPISRHQTIVYANSELASDEMICEVKAQFITFFTMEVRPKLTFQGYMGQIYWGCLEYIWRDHIPHAFLQIFWLSSNIKKHITSSEYTLDPIYLLSLRSVLKQCLSTATCDGNASFFSFCRSTASFVGHW